MVLVEQLPLIKRSTREAERVGHRERDGGREGMGVVDDTGCGRGLCAAEFGPLGLTTGDQVIVIVH